MQLDAFIIGDNELPFVPLFVIGAEGKMFKCYDTSVQNIMQIKVYAY